VNKNVSTGTVIRTKPGTEQCVHKLPANLSMWFRFWVKFMNAPKHNPLKHDEQSSRCRSQILVSK